MTEKENKLYLADPCYLIPREMVQDKLNWNKVDNYLVIAQDKETAHREIEEYLKKRNVPAKMIGVKELTQGKDLPLELRIRILQEANFLQIIQN